MDCSLPGSSIHGIFQARILEWVAIAFSRDSYYRNSNQIVIPKGFYKAVFRSDLNLIGGLE